MCFALVASSRRQETGGRKTDRSVSCVLSPAPRLSLQRLIVLQAAGWQVGFAAVGQRGFGSGELVGIVVFPLDGNGALKADSVQLDENLFEAVGIARGARGH